MNEKLEEFTSVVYATLEEAKNVPNYHITGINVSEGNPPDYYTIITKWKSDKEEVVVKCCTSPENAARRNKESLLVMFNDVAVQLRRHKRWDAMYSEFRKLMAETCDSLEDAPGLVKGYALGKGLCPQEAQAFVERLKRDIDRAED